MFNRLTSLFSRHRKGIGVEITPNKINLVQLSKERQQYKLTKYLSVELAEGIFEEGKIINSLALAELLKEIVTEYKIKNKRVATAVPVGETIIKIIPLPAELDEQDLEEQINHEAALYLPYPREEVDLDYQKLDNFIDEDGIEKVQVLLVATRRDITDLYWETFQEAGLQLDVLDINSFALIRTVREELRKFGSKEAVVLIDIEFDSTEIAIIGDGVPRFSRTISIGTYQLQNALSRAMNLPPARNTGVLQGMTIPIENTDTTDTSSTSVSPGVASLLNILTELTDELRRSINFYLNQSEGIEVAQIFLAGPGSTIGQLDEFFTQRLGVPTMMIDPFASLAVKLDEQLEEEILNVKRSALGIVLGLGMRET